MTHTTRPHDELLSINDAADLSGHSVATYRWYRANGIGPKSWKCGRYVRYWRVRRSRMDGCAGSRDLRVVACSDHLIGNTIRR